LKDCLRIPAAKQDWARQIKWPLGIRYPDAQKVVLVRDNANHRFKNTHAFSSPYKTFLSSAWHPRGTYPKEGG
jgi:hypothetical protein